MDQKACRTQIANELMALGIIPGQTIILHSSLKALGPVPGGIETIIQAFLDLLGPDGTLVMPALSWSLRPPECFDVKSTRSIVGAISEYFRKRDGTKRSLHPTHSVCAIGRRCSELLDGHDLDNTPCGPNSPFHKISETNGAIVMLGCGLSPNTTMHALEEYATPPYLFDQRYMFTITDAKGKTYNKEYMTHGFTSHGYAQRYDRVATLESRSFLREGLVLNAPSFALDSPGLKESVLKKLSENPLFFVQSL